MPSVKLEMETEERDGGESRGKGDTALPPGEGGCVTEERQGSQQKQQHV